MVCPICLNQEAQESSHPTKDASVVACPQCGDFTISRRAVVNLETVSNADHWRVSAWVREYMPPIVTPQDIESARSARIPLLHSRAEKMLKWLGDRFSRGEEFGLNDLGKASLSTEGGFIGGLVLHASPLVPIGWHRDPEEAMNFMSTVLCEEFEWLIRCSANSYKLSAKGLLALEKTPNAERVVGFCAMWFSPDVLSLWTQVIEPAVRAAGYEPLRIDAKQHNGKIDDEIMASIRASRFVVSDFTGNRGGVYYEAGFAHGLGLPVIFMCREGDDLHFDIRQYNCIF